MRRIVFAAFALTVLAACQPATTELTDEMKAEITEAVRQVNADYWAAWARMENFDAYAAYYSNHSADFPLVEFGSREEHRSAVIPIWDGLHTWEIQQMELGVRVLSPDEAFLAGSTVSLLTDTAGVTVVWEQDWANVWILEEGRWKLGAGQVFTEVREPQ